MQKLTDNEVAIYMKLPTMIQAYISTNCQGLIWQESKYGLGYNLNRSGILFAQKTSDFGEYGSLGLSTTGTSITDPFTIIGTPTTAPSSGTFMVPTVSNLNSYYTVKSSIQTMKPKKKEGWSTPHNPGGIPHNPDEIIDTLVEFVCEFAKASAIDYEQEGSPINFNFTIDNPILKCNIMILSEKIEVESNTPRGLALSLFLEVTEFLRKNYKPSITDLVMVNNIFKDEDGRKSILFKQYMGRILFDRTRYDIFVEEVTPRRGGFIANNGDKSKSIFFGEIQFLEGIFRIYEQEVVPHTYNNSTLLNTSLTINSPGGWLTQTGSTSSSVIGITSDLISAAGITLDSNNKAIAAEMAVKIDKMRESMTDIMTDAFQNDIISASTMEKWFDNVK